MDVVDAVKVQSKLPQAPILETVEAARTSIANASVELDERYRLQSWNFRDWRRCTCGHIYGAALGKQASAGESVLHSEDEHYLAVLRVIAAALAPPTADWSTADTNTCASFISDRTRKYARMHLGVGGTRGGALHVLDKAIAHIKAEQEKDRLNLLKALGEMDADGETVTPDPSDPESQPGPAAPDDAPEVDPQEQPAQEPQATA